MQCWKLYGIKHKLPKSVDKIWCLNCTGYGLISFSSFEAGGIFQTVMTMQWHLTLVTPASCLTSFLICSTHCTGFGKYLLACSGRNLLWKMGPFLYWECCWNTTNWHLSSFVVTFEVSHSRMCQICEHVFVGIRSFFLHQFAVDYDDAGKDSVHHMKGQCPSYERTVSIIWKDVSIIWKDSVHHMKWQCPSYERTVSIIWKDSVHHMKGQCSSYERTVSVIWKDSVHHMKGQCPSYERTVSNMWKDSVHHMKGQCPSYERTVSIMWKDSVHHMKEYLLLALVGIFSWLVSKWTSDHACPLLPFVCSIVWTFPWLSSCFLFFLCSSFPYSPVQMTVYKHLWYRVMSQLINRNLIFCLLHHFQLFLY